MRGLSCVSMYVIVFAIRHLRQRKIWYRVKGHYHLVNRSNECRILFFFYKNNLIVTTNEKRDLNSSSPNKEEKVMPLNYKIFNNEGKN